MADFSTLIASLEATIKTNGEQAITGAILQEELLEMVDAINTLKQDYLTFDDEPRSGSTNPVKSGGVYSALAGKQDTLTFDTEPTYGSSNPVTSNGVFEKIEGRSDYLYGLISQKQEIPLDFTSGNLAEFDSSGNTIDAGIAADDIVVREGIYPTLAAGEITKVMAGQEFVNRATADGAGIVDGIQQLKAIYGNSQQFNQLGSEFYPQLKSFLEGKGLTVTIDDNGDYTLNGTISASGPASLSYNTISWISGHKYYCRNNTASGVNLYATTAGIETYYGAQWVKEATASGSQRLGIYLLSGYTLTNYKLLRPQIIDLTLAGIDSLTTTSEVEAWLAEHIGSNDYYANNAGEILNNKTTALQTTDGDGNTSTLTLDLTSITSGGVQICADGLKSAGQSSSAPRQKLIVDADGWARRLYSPVAMVDMGDLSWGYGDSVFYAYISDAFLYAYNIAPDALCSRYSPVAWNQISNDKSFAIFNGYVKGIHLKDTSYDGSTTEGLASFVSAMSGVKLIYELATPVTYTLDTPIYCGFTAYNGGTEVQVPANGSTPTTAPFYADVIYRIPASSVITEGSLTNLLNALKSAGKITSYTLNFDDESGNYEFTIS